MAFAIPDVPREINVQIQREKLLASEALFENDLAKLQREKDGAFEDPERLGGRRGSRLSCDYGTGHPNKDSKPPE